MKTEEKQITYKHTNSYSTLNTLTSQTRNVWFVCHGLGYLSRYFLNYFKAFPAEHNYIIAPQAPSKYYQGNDFKHVGACWLTKENTHTENENIMAYLDTVYDTEKIPQHCNLIAFGYSQGVSVLLRWIARKKVSPSKIIIYAGGIPEELTAENFSFLDVSKTTTYHVFGNNDPYINNQRLEHEFDKLQTLFGNTVVHRSFEGGHELKTSILSEFI